MNKEKALKNQGLEFREDIKNEGRNHYGRIKKIFETSTRLKSWDSRTSRKGKYLKRTRASLQQANPCRYSPRVADGRSSRHGLSLRFA